MLIPPKLLSPRPVLNRAGNIFRAGKIFRVGKTFRTGNPLLTGNPRIRPPGLRNPPGTVPTDPVGLPLAIPDLWGYNLPRKGGYPRTRGGLSLLPRIFRRHQHPLLGCQLRSPECFKYTQMTAIIMSTPDSDRIGLFWQVPLRPRIY